MKIHAPSAHQSNSEFEILPVKKFGLKKTKNQMLPATIEKMKFLLFKKTVYVSFR